jgi:hypothetical protein
MVAVGSYPTELGMVKNNDDCSFAMENPCAPHWQFCCIVDPSSWSHFHAVSSKHRALDSDSRPR